jgi:hypothetical protein
MLLLDQQPSIARHWGGGGTPPPPIHGLTWGTRFYYNDTVYSGDGWGNTWADDGNIYAFVGDAGNPAPQNISVGLTHLSTFDSSVTITTINDLFPLYGGAAYTGSDGCEAKAGGLISIHGVLYTWMWRLNVGSCTNNSGQLIKSLNHGADSFMPQPSHQADPFISSDCTLSVCPMFSGTNPKPYGFVQYGQDYQTQTADRSATYVYALAEKYIFGGTITDVGMLLMRCTIANIGGLHATDWQWYQGGDGALDANWGASSTAAVMIAAPNSGQDWGMQYLPYFQQYIFIGGGNPSTPQTWYTYVAQHPWGNGPYSTGVAGTWDLIDTHNWGYDIYQQMPMPKSVMVDGGRTFTVSAARAPASGFYSLSLITATPN